MMMITQKLVNKKLLEFDERVVQLFVLFVLLEDVQDSIVLLRRMCGSCISTGVWMAFCSRLTSLVPTLADSCCCLV